MELTELERQIARYVAWQRNVDGERAGADAGKHGYSGDQLELHYRGALGEMAFAKATNRFWTGAGCTYHEDDDVGRVQIRTSVHENACLIMRPSEGALEDPWVLVVGEGVVYRIAGWMWGREGRQEQWLRAPNGRPPAYFVPQSALRPVRRKT